MLLFQHLLFICLNCASFPTASLQLALVFSTLPFMTRVRRLNARKDCLVCIVGVIAGGHYDQGRDLNAKLHDHYFIFNGFASKDSLPLICLLHINTDVDDDDNHILVMMMTKKNCIEHFSMMTLLMMMMMMMMMMIVGQ